MKCTDCQFKIKCEDCGKEIKGIAKVPHNFIGGGDGCGCSCHNHDSAAAGYFNPHPNNPCYCVSQVTRQ